MADGLVLTHGAGGDAEAPSLVALAARLEARGLTLHRYDQTIAAAFLDFIAGLAATEER